MTRQTHSPLSHRTGILIVLFVGLASYTALESNIVEHQEIFSTASIAGATAVSAVVPTTPTNTLYEDLQKQKAELNQKDKELRAKESYLNSRFEPTPAAIHTLYILVAALFILVIINFILDLRRKTQRQTY